MPKHARCPTCGQPVVSSHAGPGARRAKRKQSGRAARPEPDALQVSTGDGNRVRYDLGQVVTVALHFAGGSYRGKAKIVEATVNPIVEFVYKRKKRRRMWISETEIKENTT